MLYRPLFREAWLLTWQRKSLWIFGIFAALISTGGVMDTVGATLQKIERTESLLAQLMDHSFIGYPLASEYIQQLNLLGTYRVGFLLLATTISAVLLLVISVLSQGALLLGIGSSKTQEPYQLRRMASTSFWSLFVVGVLNKLMMCVVTLLLILPLWLVAVSGSVIHGLFFFVLMLLFIPVSVIINIVYMFAIIHVVEEKAHPLDAIHLGLNLFRKQWLATLEYGLMLFLIVFGAGLAVLLASSLLFIPYALVSPVILLSGSTSLFIGMNVVFGLLFLGIILAFGGASVTFQYSAWHVFYKRGVHKTHGKKIFSKLIRLVDIVHEKIVEKKSVQI